MFVFCDFARMTDDLWKGIRLKHVSLYRIAKTNSRAGTHSNTCKRNKKTPG